MARNLFQRAPSCDGEWCQGLTLKNGGYPATQDQSPGSPHQNSQESFSFRIGCGAPGGGLLLEGRGGKHIGLFEMSHPSQGRESAVFPVKPQWPYSESPACKMPLDEKLKSLSWLGAQPKVSVDIPWLPILLTLDLILLFSHWTTAEIRVLLSHQCQVLTIGSHSDC